MNPRGDRARSEASSVEQERIDFLVRRDGTASAIVWVRRTMRIYRRAVLDKRHHASVPGFRHRFIVSYRTFKTWLARTAAEHSQA